LSAGNITYIKNTLSNERESLLKAINLLNEKEKGLESAFQKVKDNNTEKIKKARTAFTDLKK